MISDCGSEVGRLTEGLAESREALKQIEATLKSTEDAHAAETSQLEVQVSGLERDLGKSASALFRMKKEKKAKASEVRRLQRQIQSQEEPRTREPAGHARLTRMAVLFDSLVAVRKKDLALADIEGGLSEIQLLKGEAVPTLDSEEVMLLSHKEELMASEGDFDSILSLLKSECTLTPCLEKTEGQGRAAKEGEGDAVERGDGEVAEGGMAKRSRVPMRLWMKAVLRGVPRGVDIMPLRCQDPARLGLGQDLVCELLSAYTTYLDMNGATSKGRLEMLTKFRISCIARYGILVECKRGYPFEGG
ncbi:hypothetical protein F2Q69_00035489 [Brassica cretica]|uniref:Uncharacterized protein n=1 Tax=Brassica cretica TaxID=69181 RepID=A0A8S9SQZ9_BRACR|nr:hypothetical protein F2Q69_00035489 [Brassica cretica]